MISDHCVLIPCRFHYAADGGVVQAEGLGDVFETVTACGMGLGNSAVASGLAAFSPLLVQCLVF
jgi:hypothetical protein